MKMKLILLGVLCALLVQPASAQVARYYNLFSLADGSTNDLTATLPAATTNQIVLLGGTVTNQFGSPTATTITSSNILLHCHEFDKCGFTFQSVGIAGSTNGIFGVQIYASMSKGAVIDPNPRWSFTTNAAAPGGQTYTVITNLDLSGIDILYFSFINGSANGWQSNVIAGVELKSPKYGAKAATQ
jgi:hypothetical protein